MRNVLIFHGTGGHPKENWFPWLKEKLEEKYSCKVFIPQFPHPRDYPLSDWLKVLEDYKQYINEETILIGHSLGGLFLLRVLEGLENPVKSAFFVAAPVGIRPIRFYESDNKFSGFNFDWKKIKKGAKYFAVYHSDTDPYVSLGNGEELAKKLGVKVTFIPDAGHINAEAGYTKFERLLEDVGKVFEVNTSGVGD